MQNPIPIEEAWATRPIPYLVRRPPAFVDRGLAVEVFTGGIADRRASARRFGLIGPLFLTLSLTLVILLVGCSSETEYDSEDSPPAASEIARVQQSAGDATTAAATEDRPVLVFLGTSLTAGYGLEESQAFPALIQERIDEADLNFRVINAGVSGDTSAGGLRRLSWLLRLPVAVLVLELGANDMLRGQRVDQLASNLETILDRTTEAHPGVRIVVAGMRAAPNLGREYAERFDAVYPDLAQRYDAAFMPFLLEDVAARRNLNQADGLHPTAEGHLLIAERMWKILRPVLD
jgi:acyl-CoA thioesterase-1